MYRSNHDKITRDIVKLNDNTAYKIFMQNGDLYRVQLDIGIIKLILEYILPSLTHIINLSLSSSTFPSDWKEAKVVPLLKKGDLFNPVNYRPVALLPVLSKVLEKVVYNQIVKYAEVNCILSQPNNKTTPTTKQP